ncbi:Maf family protein [Marinimicrobium sp. C2-29]|uniref:Maf family protein n=1 Tax=Marinimicrobium sp. C2-29 TaxID=3139825 RepID=UPI00313A3034
MLRLLLASSSPYRRQLLERLGLPFDCQSPDIDETPAPGEPPEALARRLAQGKAQALATPPPTDQLIIGSDQVACLNGKTLGKPGNHTNAKAQLAAASGQTVTFYTGLCLHDNRTGRSETRCDTYRVHFRTLSEAQIESYLAKETPYDCAGSFKAEGLGIRLFERMEGTDPNSLIGLPLIALTDLLLSAGVDPLQPLPGH